MGSDFCRRRFGLINREEHQVSVCVGRLPLFVVFFAEYPADALIEPLVSVVRQGPMCAGHSTTRVLTGSHGLLQIDVVGDLCVDITVAQRTNFEADVLVMGIDERRRDSEIDNG